MAENSGRGNIIDAADGPRGGDMVPPPVSDDVKSALRDEVRRDGERVHESGQEVGMRPDPAIGAEREGGKEVRQGKDT